MEIRILGVMTGTSCDALDASCVRFRISKSRPLGVSEFTEEWSGSFPFPNRLKARVLTLQNNNAKFSLQEIIQLNRDLGKWYATSLTALLSEVKRDGLHLPHAIANHGQTLAHHPEQQLTCQMGDPAWIANETGISVISHFRNGDLAAGGQGAPLVPLYHQLLARKLFGSERGVALHNLGGISNLSVFPTRSKILAFDTGPGNLWIDQAMRHLTGGRKNLDRNGATARTGTMHLPAVKKILALPFFRKAAPKSIGRDQLPFSLLLQHLSSKQANCADLVATATEITAQSIFLAYQNEVIRKNFPLKRIVLCGGGAKNCFLVERIQNAMGTLPVERLSDSGVAVDTVEAQAFAYLGLKALLGQPLGGPWTGAALFGAPAQITPSKNWRQLQSILHGMLSQK